MLVAFGIVLLICLVLPWQHTDSAKFAWDLAEDDVTFHRFAIMIGLAGLTAVLMGSVNVSTLVRGWVALALGLVPIFWAVARARGDVQWRGLTIILALVVLAAGHLLRGQRRSSSLARIACTAAFAVIVIAYLTPDHGTMYLERIFDKIDKAKGKFVVIPLIDLAPLVVSATGLLAWRAPTAGRSASDLAWLAICVLPLGTIANVLVVMTEDRFGEYFRRQIFLLMQLPIVMIAWLAFAAYGLAIIAADVERRSDPS